MKKQFQSHQYQLSSDYQCDVIIVGGGIVGCATARALKIKYPELKMAILEKEIDVGLHQSGRNSGVIHSGIYYKPGSLQAKLCVSGRQKLIKYLQDNSIPYKKCGKLIVALNQLETDRLKKLYDQGIANNIGELNFLDNLEQINKIEPFIKGVAALHCASTSIVNYGMVTESFARDFSNLGGKVYTRFEVSKIETSPLKDFPISILSKDSEQKHKMEAKYAIFCGGLYSDRLASACGGNLVPAILPVRGEYLVLKRPELINGCIYPVPFPGLPFLGVHFTPQIDGGGLLGPNAVPAFHREGYSYGHVNVSDLLEMITYPGFWRLAFKFCGFGLSEVSKSLFIGKKVSELKKYMPSLTVDDVMRGPSGVRAQALDIDGSFITDFVFEEGQALGNSTPRILHVRNSASPASTSSMAIADEIVSRFESMVLS